MFPSGIDGEQMVQLYGYLYQRSILAAYKDLSGVPVLINTSFNVHEEPIINSPDECARALADGRVDFVVTEGGVYGRGGAD